MCLALVLLVFIETTTGARPDKLLIKAKDLPV